MSGTSGHLPDTFLDSSYSIPYNNIPHGSRPDFNILSHTHSDSLSSHSTSTFSIIASASHQDLVRSGNAAFSSVNMLYLEAKCELQAQLKLVAQLQDVISKLTSPRHLQAPSMPDTAPSEDKSDTLDNPDPPQPLNQEDYPYVSYWNEDDWVKYLERQRNSGQVPSRLGFLTDEDGCPVPESRIKTFISWTKKTPKSASYLAYIMKKGFEEFRYCDGDWKVERFAIIKYPDWCRDARETGRLTRARPSKRKSGDGNPLKDERRQKKVKAKSTMLPRAQENEVIDLDAPTSPVAPAPLNPPSSSITPLASGPFLSPIPTAVPGPTTHIPNTTAIPSPVSHPPSAPDLTTTHIPNTTAIPSPASHPPSAPDLTPEESAPSPSDHASHPAITPSAPVCTDENALPSPPTANAPIQGISTEQTVATVDVATSPVDPGQQGRPRRVNPLAGLSVRKPSIQVPEDEPRNVPSGEADPATTTRKSGKSMVASSTALTARNLFAIDYLKEHPMTTKPEFKTVWDNITSENKKKYEALSKERKLAASLAATTTANGSNAS